MATVTADCVNPVITARGTRARRDAITAYTAWLLPLLAALLATAGPAYAATATWIAGDGSYTDAANWDSNPVVPLNNGIAWDVMIAGAGTDVTFGTPIVGAVDSLTLGGGTSFITDSAGAAFSATLTTANDATLVAEDQSLLDLGGGNLDRSSLIARKGFLGSGGATLTTSISSWAGTNGFNLDRSFSADGAGTLLDLSSLTSIERNGGSTTSDLNITATDGGRVDLTGISAFDDNASGTNGRVNITVNGAGSQVDLPGVTTISDVHIEVRDGGELTGQLQSLTGRSQLIKRSTGIIDLGALTSADNATLIAEDGALLDLGTASIDRADLIARKGFLGSGGATLTTSISSWAGTNGFNLDRSFSADGAGTLLDLSSLTSIERNGGSTTSDLNITATDGGRVDLTGISAFDDNASGTNGRVNITVNGAGSQVDLPGVTTISDVHIEVRDGGELTGQLQSLTGRSQLIKRSTGIIDLGALTSADNAMLIAEDGALLDLGTASIDRADLIARKGFLGSGGATLTTSVTSWAGTNGFNLDRGFSADGAGTLLDLSSLTSIERNGGSTTSDLNITATDGGRVDLTGISAFDDNASGTNGRVNITVNGAGSQVDLPGVTTISDVHIEVRDGGELTGQLQSLTGRSQLIKRSTGIIDLGALTSADNAMLIAEDGALLDLGTASIDRADLIARKGFLGSGGATLTTGVTSWAGTNGFNLDRGFSADGAGTLLDLSSLTSIERNGGSTTSDLNITATDGGRVDLTGISAFDDNASGTNGRVNITVNGAGSQVDLANVTTLNGTDVTIADTATVDLGQLAAFSDGIIELATTDAAAADLHVADSLELGSLGFLMVAGSSAAVVVGPGTPAGAADGTVTVAAGGTLGGTGTVVGTLLNDGTVAPGTSPGLFAVDGDYTQSAGALLDLEIGGLAAGFEFDFMNITGSATLAGALGISLVDGYTPGIGDSFLFMLAADGVNGQFDDIFCGNCSGVAFDIVYGASFVSLNTIAAPIPLPPALVLLLSALLVLPRRGTRA